jgi:GTPase
MFLDQTKIHVVSGQGGHGMASFHREKYVPFGGPDGGNGGRGGSIYFKVNEQFSTLLDMGNKRKYKADAGGNGGVKRQTGKSGDDIIISVPKGTLIKDSNGRLLADLTVPGQTWLAAKGGDGGRGNYNYASSTNQAPRKNTEGKPGQDIVYHLELKLMADVGLVGFPNAGKSSLVRKISGARPKVDNYPFTTLEPILGIVQLRKERSFVIADIPGLIEGAADGKGLGHTFLKHIERTHALLYVIDGSLEEAKDQFYTLKKELKKFHPGLSEKPYLVVLNKLDMGIDEQIEVFKQEKIKCIPISALSGEGLPALMKGFESILPEPEFGPGHRDGNW